MKPPIYSLVCEENPEKVGCRVAQQTWIMAGVADQKYDLTF
jgi:hypothetical protein